MLETRALGGRQGEPGVLQHAIDGRPPMQTDAQARLRWGEEPSFDIIDPTPATQPSVTVVWPNDPSQPDNQGLPDQVTIAATEIDRKTRTVRVTNPDDDTQYVDVEDVVKSLLRIDATGAPVYLSIDWLQRSGG